MMVYMRGRWGGCKEVKDTCAIKLFVCNEITAKTDQWQAYHKEICCIAPQRFAQGIFFFAGRCPANFNIWHDALLTRRDDVQL